MHQLAKDFFDRTGFSIAMDELSASMMLDIGFCNVTIHIVKNTPIVEIISICFLHPIKETFSVMSIRYDLPSENISIDKLNLIELFKQITDYIDTDCHSDLIFNNKKFNIIY